MRRFDKFNKYELKKVFCVCLASTMMLGAMSCGKADEDNNPSSSIIKDLLQTQVKSSMRIQRMLRLRLRK